MKYNHFDPLVRIAPQLDLPRLRDSTKIKKLIAIRNTGDWGNLSNQPWNWKDKNIRHSPMVSWGGRKRRVIDILYEQLIEPLQDGFKIAHSGSWLNVNPSMGLLVKTTGEPDFIYDPDVHDLIEMIEERELDDYFQIVKAFEDDFLPWQIEQAAQASDVTIDRRFQYFKRNT